MAENAPPPAPRLPRVTVVTPIYNNAKMIADCLHSLLPQDYPDYEVIVVDDGSTDGTAEEVRRHPVRLIVNEHLGISAARNAAIREATGEVVVLVDSDLKVGKDLLRRLVEGLYRDPKRGVAMAWWDISNPENLVASLIYRGYEYFTHDLDEPNFFWGYCFAIKKEVLDRAGFFDETLPLVEDVDYAYRVVSLGYKIKILREVKVWHYFRDNLRKHLTRHFQTARHKFLYVRATGRYTDQRGTGAEYLKILLHAAWLASVLTLPWTPWIFLAALGASLLSHLKITLWSMRQGFKYVLMLPFEFLTKLAWVLGIVQGAFWLARGREVSPREM